ncbi:MAG TPA: cytochrome c [Burkholderiales bacterium]
MRRIVAALVPLALLVSGGAHAQSGNPEAGALKAAQCAGCHGIPGYRNAYPAYRVPKLGGQHAEYIVAALQGYKSGARRHPTMQAIAAGLNEQDMADLAAFFAAAGGQSQ